MSNPLYKQFGGQPPFNPANRLGNAMQMASMFKQIQNDPSKIADILLQSNRINQQQYEQLKQFNGNPEQMGRFLLQSGVINQQQINSLQNMVPQFRGLFNN